MSVSTDSVDDNELPANEPSEPEQPWRDKDVLSYLYWSRELTQEEIGEKFGKTRQTISRWMDRLDIPTRNDTSVSHQIEERDGKPTYEKWCYAETSIYVHKLLAVAEFGWKAVVKADHVHHRNACKFDNRPANVEPVTNEKHGRLHSNEAEWTVIDGFPQLTVN